MLVEKKIKGNNVFKKIIEKKYSNCMFFTIVILFKKIKNNKINNTKKKVIKNILVLLIFKWPNQIIESKPRNNIKNITDSDVRITPNLITTLLDKILFVLVFLETVVTDLFIELDFVLTVNNKYKVLVIEKNINNMNDTS